jgi:hypothetical protein
MKHQMFSMSSQLRMQLCSVGVDEGVRVANINAQVHVPLGIAEARVLLAQDTVHDA